MRHLSVVVASGGVGYARFHGRNPAKWYDHKGARERYGYTYSPAELEEWVPRLRESDAATPLTLVYFNNHYGDRLCAARATWGNFCRGWIERKMAW